MNVYEKTYSILILEHQPVQFRTRQQCNERHSVYQILWCGLLSGKGIRCQRVPYEFKLAFRRINELFIAEAKKYDVGKQLKKR